MKIKAVKLFISLTIICICNHSFAQNKNFSQIDLTGGINSSHSNISCSYQYIIREKAGENRKSKPIFLEYGIGGRFGMFSGSDLYFATVPEYFGGWIPDKDPDPTHYDSVFVSSPQIFAVNFLANITFCIKDRLRIGATADIIGYSFGGKRRGEYINGTDRQNVSVSPQHFNIALYSDGNRGEGTGSLNLEWYAAYVINREWSVKIGIQSIKTEYVTDTEIQQYPEPNDRFRNESYLLSAGVIFKTH